MLSYLRQSYVQKCLNNNQQFGLVFLRSKSDSGPLSCLQEKVHQGILQDDKNQLEIMKSMEIVYENIQNYSPPSKWSKMLFQSKVPVGLYLYGAVGRGKTMLMDIFYDCCKMEKKRKVHFNEFMTDVHSRIHLAKKNRKEVKHTGSDKPRPWDPIAPVAQELISDAWLLCFDEFQVTDIADAMILKRLFTELFNNGMVMVATSNRSPDDLYKSGLQRSNFLPFIPVLKKHCAVVNLDSQTDYRTQGNPYARKYYFVIGQDGIEADKELDLIFRILASKETDTIGTKTIMVKGRHVSLKKVCGGVLDATFHELCEQALGSADYLQFAQIFHTIIIRNVPRMNLTYRNQARRFIQLMDILYDYKIRVVISAVALPGGLFTQEGDHQDDSHRMLMDDLQITAGSENASANIFTGHEELFAFERTVSRLMEMQTTTYWEKWERK